MRIDGWQIEGFGIFRDCEIRGLSSGLTVFLGPNEAGKSTLLGFLRAVLFGFPGRRSRTPQYPPLRGGRHGGRVILAGPDGEVTIERIASRRNGLRVNGQEATPQDLQALLGGADENLFSSVFAFSLAELQSFEWLQVEQVRERIFSAGIAGAGASARHVIDKLEAEAASFYRPRGACRVRELIEMIDRTEGQLKIAETEAGRYLSLVDDQEQWTLRAATLATQEQELRRRLELSSELQRARDQLSTLPPVDEFPDDPEGRLAELTLRLEQSRARAKLAGTLDDKLAAVADRVEELHSRLALHRHRLDTLRAAPPAQRLVAWALLGGAIAFAGGMLAARGEIAAGVVTLLAGLFLAGLLVYQRAVRSATRMRLEHEIADWEQCTREALGATRSGDGLIAELLDVRERCRKDSEIRTKLAAFEDAPNADAALEAFRSQMQLFRRHRELGARIAELGTKAAPGSPKELTVDIQHVQAARDEAVGQHRLCREALDRIAESDAIPTLTAELECLRFELAECVRQWRVATIAAELVARTLQVFTDTRQPAVLEEASSAFSRVTAGAYQRIVQDESGSGLLVVDRDSLRKQPEELSRGAAEQLYLCLRLALASEFARRAESLPLIMDDVLVNFDPQRAGAVAQELIRIANQRQILVFTCHPETVRLFTEAAPATAVIHMERQGASAAQ